MNTEHQPAHEDGATWCRLCGTFSCYFTDIACDPKEPSERFWESGYAPSAEEAQK